MKRFANILLVLHEHCDRTAALDWAASVAQENQATLDVLEVIDAPPSGVRQYVDVLRPLLRDEPGDLLRRRQRRRLLRAAAGIRAQGIAGETEVIEGPALPAILDETRTHAYDLIVVPEEQQHGLRHWLFGGATAPGVFGGSLADHILRRVPCSVLILNLGNVAPGAMCKRSLPVKPMSRCSAHG